MSVLWVAYGYTFSFDTDIRGLIGGASKLFLKGVGPNSISDLAKTIPEYIFVAYQLTFAAITVGPLGRQGIAERNGMASRRLWYARRNRTRVSLGIGRAFRKAGQF